jgi:deazaflavin-dependent oxidoreductase (nitroreductase family)
MDPVKANISSRIVSTQIHTARERLRVKRDLSWPIRVGFIFHRVTNPFVRLILRSPLHSMLSGRLILITYTGKKSGTKHTLPVQYAKSDHELIVVAGYHQHKKWWRNLRQQSTIKVCYRGTWFEASATVFEGDVALIVPLFPAYLRRFPASARIRGLTLDPSGNVEDAEKLREAAKRVVMVNIMMPTLKAQASSKHLV